MTDAIPDWTVGADPRADRVDPAPDSDERSALDERLDWHRRTLVASVASLDERAALRRDRYPEQPNLRWIMVHTIEEHARHNGHADLFRECIDGVTGD